MGYMGEDGDERLQLVSFHSTSKVPLLIGSCVDPFHSWRHAILLRFVVFSYAKAVILANPSGMK